MPMFCMPTINGLTSAFAARVIPPGMRFCQWHLQQLDKVFPCPGSIPVADACIELNEHWGHEKQLHLIEKASYSMTPALHTSSMSKMHF